MLGDGLLAVWLYGSRARGDADLEATDPDLRSDVDLMVIVDPSLGWTTFGGEVIPFVSEAAEAEGESPVWSIATSWSCTGARWNESALRGSSGAL